MSAAFVYLSAPDLALTQISVEVVTVIVLLLALLRGLAGVDLIGGDVVEVAPQYDATTNTAHAGAQVLFEILSLMVFSPAIGAINT